MKNIIEVFKWNEEEVFSEFVKAITEEPDISREGLYAFWDRRSPICVQAHIDVVKGFTSYNKGHWDKELSKWVEDEETAAITDRNKLIVMRYRDIIGCTNGILGGDDRAGIIAIITIERNCKKMGLPRPSIILSNKEESGSAGMKSFADDMSKKILSPIRLLIGLDRRGLGEYVYYEEPAKQAKNYVESFGFVKSHGSYSDGKIVSAKFEIPNVNLSIGYYDNHMRSETVHLDETMLTVSRVLDMIKDPIDKNYGIVKYEPYSWKRDDPDEFKNKSNVIALTDNKKDGKKITSAAEGKRLKRCEKLQQRFCLPYTAARFPYFDYKLSNEMIKRGFHVVSSTGWFKRLEEWNEIFCTDKDLPGAKVWRHIYGKCRKIYVDAGNMMYYLAICIDDIMFSDRLAALSARKCEYAEIADIAKSADEAEKATKEGKEASGDVDSDKTLNEFASQNGFCKRFASKSNGCNGGCMGSISACSETGGPDLTDNEENEADEIVRSIGFGYPGTDMRFN